MFSTCVENSKSVEYEMRNNNINIEMNSDDLYIKHNYACILLLLSIIPFQQNIQSNNILPFDFEQTLSASP